MTLKEVFRTISVRSQRHRGAALLLVLMVSAVFLILIGTLIDVLAMESQNVRESATADAALTAAYSGVDVLILNIEEFYVNGIHNGQFPQTADCAFSDPGGATSTPVSCHAQVMTTWNGVGRNYYLIESTGTAGAATNQQDVSRVVDALVREIPFGTFAMFTESERSNTGGRVWYSSGQSYNGPVYSGGEMHIRYDSNNSTPIFPQGFTTSDPNFNWYDIADANQGPPDTSAENASVYGSQGQKNITNSRLALPGLAQNLVVFSEAFYGNSSHTDSGDPNLTSAPLGVYVDGTNTASGAGGTLSSGIFVHGDAVITATGVGNGNGNLSSGTETFKFDPPPGNNDQNAIPQEVVVAIDFSNGGTTTVTTGSSVVGYTGIPSGEPTGTNPNQQGNGAIFVNGNLSIAGGSTIHGQYTIAVPDGASNGPTITLAGSVKYANDPRSGASQDELALWANDIWLSTGEANPEIDGMILTGYGGECIPGPGCNPDGFFANQNCHSVTCSGGGGTDQAVFFGSLIQNVRGKMGAVGANGLLAGGYFRQDQYDPRLGANPPPFSPTTNLYTIVALQDKGSL